MARLFGLLLLLTQLICVYAASSIDAIHLQLYRRGGRFTHHQPANLSSLTQLLDKVENRYSRTYRDVESNQLVRRWTTSDDEQAMLDEAGLIGTWYTIVQIGDPPQHLEADIDLLNPDFYTLLTTSEGGSKFNTFASSSHDPGNTFAHPYCRLASDNLYLPKQKVPTRLEWPICKPSKSSRHTLSKSGTILGLAPKSHTSSSLSRLSSKSFVQMLSQKGVVASSIWSVTLLDSTTGFLSIGGTLAAQVEEAKARVEAELTYIGQENAMAKVEEDVRGRMAFAMPDGSTIEDQFRWVDVSGASGWWTGLMSGVWVDGIKILKNQPFVIDITCPFIIAPPTAFDRLYSSISGFKSLSSYRITSSHQNQSIYTSKPNTSKPFHLFPCLNPPSISFELAGWPFPLASRTHSTRDDILHGPAGGAFSLGKVEEHFDTTANTSTGHTQPASQAGSINSGFCVGIVVRSDMGERDEKRWRDSGMRDTWVLGEPFFRGLGVVFDDGDGVSGKKARMGFRSY